MGSGTTAIACKNLDRRYVGIEIESTYIKLAEERIANLNKPDLLNARKRSKRKTETQENSSANEQITLPLDSQALGESLL